MRVREHTTEADPVKDADRRFADASTDMLLHFLELNVVSFVA